MKYRIAAGLSLAASTLLGAQSGGPYAPLVLLEPAGARPLAMGNVGVTGRDDDVLFYNPAQIAVARGTSASIERYSSHAWGGTLSTVTRLANSAIAIGAQQVDYRVPVASIAAPGGFGAPGTTLSLFPVDRAASLMAGSAHGVSNELAAGYARTFKGVRIGGAAKVAQDQTPGANITRTMLDLGLSHDLFRYYTLGLAVQNVGASSTIPCLADASAGQPCAVSVDPTRPGSRSLTVPLPLKTTFGASFAHELGPFDLLSTAGATMYRTSWISPAAGAELGYSWIDGYDVDLRAGLRRPLAGEAAFTAGAGFTADRVSVDYALETFTGGRVGHRIGLRIR